MRFPLLLAVFALGQGTAGPQLKPAHLYEFQTLKTFRCDFTESEGRRTTAEGVTTSATRETFNDLVIDSVDYQNQRARFIGNYGSDTVQVFDGSMTVSFLERTQTGNVNVLSIFKRTGAVDRYRAVFSRHSALTTGDLTISQSYGSCRGLP
jgi:hypothetical protein